MEVGGTDSVNNQPPASQGVTFGNQDLGRFEFLELLVAQMANQNPLEPLENTEFVAQMAQFTQVDELIKIRQLTETSMSIMLQLINAAAPPPSDDSEPVDGEGEGEGGGTEGGETDGEGTEETSGPAPD